MKSTVLSASAVLAWLHQREGADQVESLLPGVWISSVTFAAVLGHVAERGGNVSAASTDLEAYGLLVQPFTAEHASLCAEWHTQEPLMELSLADRACLALATTSKATVLTANADWLGLELGVTVRTLI